MSFYDNNPICAIATGGIKSAIAIIRISGENFLEKLEKHIKLRNQKISLKNLETNKLYRAEIYDINNEIIDDVLVVYFRKPKSYTGEDLVEIHCHGSLYIQKKILELLYSLGIREALPGEFTLRAFLNKKIDLSQAEALNDLIQAECSKVHNILYKHYRGEVFNYIKQLRQNLLNLLMYLELELDFSEEDVEFASREKLKDLLYTLKNYINNLKTTYEYGNALKKGILVSIIGPPNVGKSTLLNTLVKEEKAIVSNIPGTTRDVIEDYFTYKGILFRFADTAGIRKPNNIIEEQGIKLAINKAKQSIIILYLIDVSSDIKNQLQLLEENSKLFSPSQNVIIVLNKIDKSVLNFNFFLDELKNKYSNYKIVSISAKFNKNINELLETMYNIIVSLNISGSEYIIVNERHFNILKKSEEFINNAIHLIENNQPNDLLAEEIRMLNYALSEITGEITSEEILKEIFSNFCIGK